MCHLLDNVEKYGAARQASDDNLIRHMCFACWITEATGTHLEYVILLLFHSNNGYTNVVPQYYVLHTLPILFEGLVTCKTEF